MENQKQLNKNNVYIKKVNYLKQYFWIVQNLLDELIRNTDNFVIQASKISGMPTNHVIRTLDDVYIKKQINREKIDQKIKELYLKKKEIENSINNISNYQERYVLKNKYLYFKTIEEISINLDKSYKQITRWHAAAIDNLEIPNSTNKTG